MKTVKIIAIILTFSLSSNIYADATSCGSGECPVLERAKDVGDAALKEMAPYIGAAIVIGLAASSGSAADSYINNIDKSPFQSGIQLLEEENKYTIDVLTFKNSYSYDPLKKNNYSLNVLEIKYKFN